MTRLHQTFQQGTTTALKQALSGLGGIGKTQTAIEYLHRYASEYTDTFWITADSSSALEAGFRNILRWKLAPEQEPNDLPVVVAAVQQWMQQNPGWLLVLDNVEQLADLEGFFPLPSEGRTLLTTRLTQLDSQRPLTLVSLEIFEEDEAVAFLLNRRYDNAAPQAEHPAAAELARELGCLPLALEQAVAYCVAQKLSLQRYLSRYHSDKLALLEKTRVVHGKYPDSVRTTWQRNFEAVQSASAGAVELLRGVAFLAPERLSYRQDDESAPELVEHLYTALTSRPACPETFEEALSTLEKYALV